MAMIDMIRSDELSRLAVCANPTCDGLVLDLTRNRSRRFCSTRCANRDAAAAYRARRRAASVPASHGAADGSTPAAGGRNSDTTRGAGVMRASKYG